MTAIGSYPNDSYAVPDHQYQTDRYRPQTRQAGAVESSRSAKRPIAVIELLASLSRKPKQVDHPGKSVRGQLRDIGI